MKTIGLKTILYIFFGVFVCSCRAVYAPNALNVPLFQEKGEFKGSISSNNLQLATAVSSHVGIIANGYLNRYKSDDKSFKNNGQGAEIGVGYFGSTPKRLTYETYAGIGFYGIKMNEANNTKTLNTDAFKYFIQPAVGWVNPYFEVAVSPRVAVVKYSTPDITGYNAQEISDNHFDILSTKSHAFVEPTLILRGGYRFIKIQAQVGHSFKLTKNKINYDDGIGSIGLIFNIAQWYKTGN